MTAHSTTPLKFLAPGWFVIVMGLCGLALAWQQATPLMGELAAAGALVLGAVAALVALVLTGASLLRWQRYPQALADDLQHPVRHAFVAAMPIALILLATLATALLGPSLPVRLVWGAGAVWQFGVTVWVLSRWLQPGAGKPGGPLWPGITPVLLLPVVGNVLVALAGVGLGFPGWSAAQLGIGLVLWLLVLALLLVRIGLNGLWSERLLPTTFITMSPPSVIGLAALQLGAPTTLAWMCWGVALLFGAWSASVFKRALSQPFTLTFWALSFPLAALAALTLRLAADAPGLFRVLAMAALALASLVVAALSLATVKGLRDGSLLAPEPVAMLNVVGSTA